MDNHHIIPVTYSGSGSYRTRAAYQYDYGQILSFDGFDLPDAFEVHFYTGGGESVTVIGHDDQVAIPDSLLKIQRTVTAWLFLHDTEDDGETRFVVEIPVRGRSAITDEEPTPEEQSVITQAIAALQTAVTKTEAAQDAAETAQEAAEAAQTGAKAAQSAAEAARDTAVSSAASAASSASASGQSAATAAERAAEAVAAASSATGSASSAAQSATTATEQAAAASGSASAAAQSANSAATSASNAASSASGAAQSATAAGQSESTAESAAMAATAAMEASEAAQTAAEAAASSASGSATAASGSAAAASGSADAAAESAREAAETVEEISGVVQDVSDLKSALGIDSIPYVQTGTGYITNNGVLTYTDGGTGLNHMMLIDDAETIASTKRIIAYLGNNMFKYGAICLDANGGILSYAEFPSQTAEPMTLEVNIPANTAKIYLYNRKPILENPSVTIIKTDGYDSRIEDVENEIASIQIETNKIPTLESETYELSAIVSNGYRTVKLSSLEFYSKGYINNAGGISLPSSTSHKIMVIDASNLSVVRFQSATSLASGLAFGVLKDSEDTILQVLSAPNTTDAVEWSFTPQEGNKLYISWYSYAVTPAPYYDSFGAKDYLSIVDAYADELGAIAPVKYMTCAKKPFDFSGKNLFFFGDSITYGYIAASGGTPSHQATNQYPKVFSQGVGASYNNYGVSGSSLAEVSGYGCIATKIQETPLSSADIVFVAGGVNDWQLGVNEATLEEAVEGICTYLSTNFSGEVIWITPINEAGRTPIQTPTQTLQNVRNVITRIALQYGYSVVQGWEFPFPKEDDDSDYISLMFQDKIHPTELGYSMYAQALRSALC